MSAPLYLFLDTETTGIEDQDQIWQLAWILETVDGEEISRRNVQIKHWMAPSPWVLANTAYVERCTADLQTESLADVIYDLRATIQQYGVRPKADVYLVGAVPSFDDYRVRKIVAPQWHYHLIDIEVLIMGAFGLDVPPSLEQLQELTGVRNWKPHDAMCDAQHVRDLMRWLRSKNVTETKESIR